MTTSLASLRGISGAAKWVSGRSYGVDAIVWSPADKLLYVRTGAAAVSTTDPSADAGTWAPWAHTGVKSVQRVALVVGTGATTQTSAITAVNTAKTTLEIIGVVSTGTTFNLQQHAFYPDFASSTSVRVTRFATSADSITVHVQVVEWR